MNNTIASPSPRTQQWLLIDYPNDFFEHPQANNKKIYLTKLFWRPWWISSNISQTMQQEPSLPFPTVV